MGTATIAAPDSCLESYRSSPSPFIIAHARLAHTALRCPLNRISRFCFFARRPPVSHTHARMTQLPLAIQMPKYTHKSRKTSHVADITHSSLYLSTGILSLSLVPPHVLSLALSEIRLPKRDGVSLQAAFFSLRRSSFDPVSIQFRSSFDPVSYYTAFSSNAWYSPSSLTRPPSWPLSLSLVSLFCRVCLLLDFE